MKYSQSVLDTFDATLAKIPNEVFRFEIFADKYKYLTDLTLLLKHINKTYSSDTKILDVGGASGVYAMVFKELLQNEVYVVDRLDMEWPKSEELDAHPMLELYDEAGIHFSKVDIRHEKLPFEDDYFDYVNAVDIIEHFDSSPKFFLKELFRVIKPNGILLFGCPNICNLQNRFKVLFGNSNMASLDRWFDKEEYKGHMREYSPKENELMLKNVSFKILSKRMGEEQLLSVLKDKVKLQKDRTENSKSLDLSKMKELFVYLFCGVYYGVVQLFPNARYFTRIIATK